MSRLPYELFLALRYLRPRRTFVSVITLISIIGVMLGVAVLIIVIAVMSGFDREWRERILSFNAHLKIVRQSETMRDYRSLMTLVRSNSEVRGVAPFVLGQVLVETQPRVGDPLIRGPVLRGVDPDLEGSVSVLPKTIVRGSYDLGGKGMVVGSEFAHEMGLSVGDRVAVYSPRSLQALKKQRQNERVEADLAEDYEVRGIFDVGFNDFNYLMIVTSLENAQDLYGLEEESVHGLFVVLRDPFQVEEVRQQLLPLLGGDYRIITWTEENAAIFGALVSEKNMMFYLLFFIMIVAAFGIVNSQITFVVHKTREIGLLKALGSTNPQVMALFLSQSMLVGVLGVSFGLGLGTLALAYRNEFLHFMTKFTGRELLPAAIYQIHELPAAMMPMDVTMICGISFFICLLAGVLPAWKAGRLEPVEALRHE